MTNRHKKKCSGSLATRAIHIKTTLRFHLIFVRLTHIQNSSNNSYCHGCWKKDTHLHCWWEQRLVFVLTKLICSLSILLNIVLQGVQEQSEKCNLFTVLLLVVSKHCGISLWRRNGLQDLAWLRALEQPWASGILFQYSCSPIKKRWDVMRGTGCEASGFYLWQ